MPQFYEHTASLQRLEIERLFLVVAPRPTPVEAHTPPRPTKESKFNFLSLLDRVLLTLNFKS